MIANVLGLQPLISKSDVNQLIQQAIMDEKSVDPLGVCLKPSSTHAADSHCSDSNLNSGSRHSKSSVGEMIAETRRPMQETCGRQTLHEINQNKRSEKNSSQAHFVLPHSQLKRGVDSSSDVNGNLPSIGSAFMKVETEDCVNDVKAGLSADKFKPLIDSRETSVNQFSDILPQGKSVSPMSGLRKSKRCNRGQRYQELVSQGILHQSRKRQEFM